MIRKATHKDIDCILKVTMACAKFMISKHIFQWNENYPTRRAFENDVKRNELYVLEIGSNVVGCIVISTLMDLEYRQIRWLTTNNQNIYVHRLAIHPDYQGRGLARKLMCFTENYAKENKFCSIRLDTYSQNKRNQKFYELRGYQKLGSVYFPKQSEHPFYCYELIL